MGSSLATHSLVVTVFKSSVIACFEAEAETEAGRLRSRSESPDNANGIIFNSGLGIHFVSILIPSFQRITVSFFPSLLRFKAQNLKSFLIGYASVYAGMRNEGMSGFFFCNLVLWS